MTPALATRGNLGDIPLDAVACIEARAGKQLDLLGDCRQVEPNRPGHQRTHVVDIHAVERTVSIDRVLDRGCGRCPGDQHVLLERSEVICRDQLAQSGSVPAKCVGDPLGVIWKTNHCLPTPVHVAHFIQDHLRKLPNPPSVCMQRTHRVEHRSAMLPITRSDLARQIDNGGQRNQCGCPTAQCTDPLSEAVSVSTRGTPAFCASSPKGVEKNPRAKKVGNAPAGVIAEILVRTFHALLFQLLDDATLVRRELSLQGGLA